MGLSVVAVGRGHSLVVVCGFSQWWPLVAEHGRSSGLHDRGPGPPGHRLSSPGAPAWLPPARGDVHLSGLGVEPLSPGLVGNFFATEPPGEVLLRMF